MHCQGQPPHLGVIIINSSLLAGTILLLKKFFNNKIYFVLGSLSLFYGAYSIQVASKEIILSFLFLFSIHIL